MNKAFAIDRDEALRSLVTRAESGDEVSLTLDGKVVAKVVPARPTPDRSDAVKAVDDLFELGKRISFDGISVKELTHGGHKY